VKTRDSGFTLLEVLVALSLLGIAVTVIMQLFSANLRALSMSEGQVNGVVRAESWMREILDLDESEIEERTWSETDEMGYRMDVSIAEVLAERTEGLQVRLYEIVLTVRWLQGLQEKSTTLRTMRVVKRKI
jgi:prepilin-type N-terminal cleavage/methylation domain-containing protein